MEEYYRLLIIELITNSSDIEYLCAVFSFAEAYPDNSSPKE